MYGRAWSPMPDTILIARCPVPECPDHGKPQEQIVSRASLYQMFDPYGSDRIFYCKTCGNVFAPTPQEKRENPERVGAGYSLTRSAPNPRPIAWQNTRNRFELWSSTPGGLQLEITSEVGRSCHNQPRNNGYPGNCTPQLNSFQCSAKSVCGGRLETKFNAFLPCPFA